MKREDSYSPHVNCTRFYDYTKLKEKVGVRNDKWLLFIMTKRKGGIAFLQTHTLLEVRCMNFNM